MKKKQKLNLKIFYQQLLKLLSPFRKVLLALLGVVAIEEMIGFVDPYIFKLIIDRLTNYDKSDLSVVFILVVAFFLFRQLRSLISYFKSRKLFRLLGDSEEYLLNEAHKKMLFLDLQYHEKENTGNKIVKVQNGVDRIRDFLASFFWDLLPTILMLVFTIVILFWIDWRFGATISFFAPLFIWATLHVNKKVRPAREKRYDKSEEAYGSMAQSIININTVKSFVQEENQLGFFAKISKKIKSLVLEEYDQRMNYNFLRWLLVDLSFFFILILGAYLLDIEKITLGTLVFVFTISRNALISMFSLSRVYDQVMENSEAISRLDKLSNEKPNITNPEDGLKPTRINGQIEFQNVSFTYDKKNKENALHKVNLEIPSQTVVALVGPSGGGKTTLARMIYRHYDPQQGKILLDGKDLRDYDLYEFRKFISIVPQEVEIFNTTVKQNISFGNPQAKFSLIKEAAKIANAEEFIQKLSKGYETVVGERGIKLSGGQRQRIGIARAILANPKILIFDEATSSLDSQSERLIQDSMEKIKTGRTTIIIAHRLSTIQKADKIIVLEEGRIAEEGSHTELLTKKEGLYNKLTELQKLGNVD
jgi:ATP-binding cassette, subfamily B, bacterial MsbA